MLQVLERLKELHKKGYIYRDVKPSNFIIGQDQTLIYILDFGLVKKIGKARPVSPTKNKKLNNNRLVGTPIFCPIAAHLG
jgi:casein kinase 1